ncbi:MAG: hypothetical protein IJU32_12020 [Pyramidobacter sp.]|nr:hypothetical protein [Pyramidobacter sp.]
MLAVQGYFDGVAIQPLEQVIAKPNQRVIITIMDEFVDLDQNLRPRSMRGALSEYADPALAQKEQGAWERAAAEKHGSV